MRNAAALRTTAAPPAMLFPEYMALAREERHTWIAPVVERYAWNHDRGADADVVLHPLTGLLRMLLWNQQVDDTTLFRLARYGPSLRANHGPWDCYRLQDMVLLNLERRKGPLGKELGEALRGLVEHLERMPDHGKATFLLAFRLFLEGYSTIPWVRDVDVEFPAGEAWRPLMDLMISGTRARGAHGEQIGPAAKVIRKAGAELAVRLVTRAAAVMEASQPVEISAAGCLLFEQMLFWVETCPELEVDEALYKICGVRWAPVESKGLLLGNCTKALIAAVARRTSTRAFACAERLANHPELKMFDEVTRLYEQLLAENVGQAVAVETGVDGFALKTEMDFVVDEVLRGGHGGPSWKGGRSLGPFGPKVHLEIAMGQMRDDLPGALRAINARVEWLAKQEPKGDGRKRNTPWLFWCCDLGELYTRILREKP